MEIKLIIGLGNPGSQYALTYHNVGFLAIDYLNKYQVLNIPEEKQAFYGASKYQMLKSNAYMNQSGNFIKKALKKHKISPEKILIVHDDSDIELGKYKFSLNRSSAGHKGVESIIKTLKTKNFWRLRIGVRKKSKINSQKSIVRIKAQEFVLKKIIKKDLLIFNKVFLLIKAKLIYF